MSIEDIRIFLNDWSMLILALLGLLAAGPKATTQLRNIFRELNVYRRLRAVELQADEVESMAHTHNREETS